MLDIENIKKQVDEILLNNENGILKEEDEEYSEEFNIEYFSKRMYGLFKNDRYYKEAYEEYQQSDNDFDKNFKEFCDRIAENRNDYKLDKAYQDMDWFRVDDQYYDGEAIFNEWKEYCAGLPTKDLDITGEEFNESYEGRDSDTKNEYMKKGAIWVNKDVENWEVSIKEISRGGDKVKITWYEWDRNNYMTWDIDQFIKDWEPKLKFPSGEEFSESYQPLNENLYMSKYDRNDYTSGTHIPRAWYENGRDRDGNLVKKISMKKVYRDIHVGSLIFDTNTDTAYIIIEFERGSVDLAFSPIRNPSKIYRTTVDDIIEYFRESSWTLLEDPHIDINNDKPETSGEEFDECLNESVLMEMPANNYTSFEITPYLICEDTYAEDENGETDYDSEPYNPIREYTVNENLPSWVESDIHYSHRDGYFTIPEMNKKLDTELVYIFGIPGYYDGATVGIVARDKDGELFDNLFSFSEEDENGDPLYNYEGPKRPYINEYTRFDLNEAHEIIDKLMNEQIELAKQVIIEWCTKLGCDIYPRDYKETLPPTSGEEFNECKLDIKNIKKQINEIVRMTDGNN